MFVSLTKNINKKLSKLLIITSSHYQSLRKFRQFCFFPHNNLNKKLNFLEMSLVWKYSERYGFSIKFEFYKE